MRATSELSEETDHAGQLLASVNKVAIAGISRNRHKDSHYVGRYLQNAGYTIYPVNPSADQILNQKAYPDLQLLPESVDVINIFVRPDAVPPLVYQAIELSPKAIWLQLGTGNHPALKKECERHGISFFQNRCIKVDHQFLIRDKQLASQ